MPKKEPSDFVKILGAMRHYLGEENKNFFAGWKLGYCRACESIVKIAGDYYQHAGRDCFGDHFEKVESEDRCIKCKSNHYSILGTYMFSADKLLPEEIIKGVDNGLKNMDFPSLYNPNLPSAVKAWENVPLYEKKKQIEEYLLMNKKIIKKKEEIRNLEEAIRTY